MGAPNEEEEEEEEVWGPHMDLMEECGTGWDTGHVVTDGETRVTHLETERALRMCYLALV